MEKITTKIINRLGVKLTPSEQCVLEDMANGNLPEWILKILSMRDLPLEVHDNLDFGEGHSGISLRYDPGIGERVVVDLGTVRERALELDRRTKSHDSFDAMFYPNATIPDNILKIALVYFGKVFLLFPDQMVNLWPSQLTDVQSSGHPLWEVENVRV